jgi:hypothetical protein
MRDYANKKLNFFLLYRVLSGEIIDMMSSENTKFIKDCIIAMAPADFRKFLLENQEEDGKQHAVARFSLSTINSICAMLWTVSLKKTEKENEEKLKSFIKEYDSFMLEHFKVSSDIYGFHLKKLEGSNLNW